MTRLISATAATLIAVATASGAFAQTTEHKTSVLTFSAPVQVPGTTLPAGTYILERANPASDTVWRIMDANRHHVVAQMFYRPTRRTWEQAAAGNGKPLIQFHETPAGTAPALKTVFYPGDTVGNEFVYPLEQARQLAALTHQPILATASNVKTTAVPALVFVQPDGALTADSQTSRASQAVGTSGTSEPQPVGTTGDSADDPAPAP